MSHTPVIEVKPTIERPNKGLTITVSGQRVTKPETAKPTIELSPKAQKIERPISPKSPHSGIQIEKPSISIVKPPKSKLQIEKSKFCVQFATAKTWMKDFKQKIKDEQTVKMHDQFTRYRFVLKNNNRKAVTVKPDKNDREKQRAQIQIIINKLNINKYNKIIDEMIQSPNFGTQAYLDDIADIMHEQALRDYNFCNLYSLFVNTIQETLNEKTSLQLRERFLSRINDNSTKEFKKEIAPKNEGAREKAVNHASFYGCLVMRKIFPIERLYEFAKMYLLQEQDETLEACIALIIPVGQMLEDKIPAAKEVIFQKLHEITTNKKYPSRLRYRALDVLDIRAAKWAGVEKHFSQIVSIENAKKRQINVNSIPAAKEEVKKPTIQASKNKFANLMDSDDDEDYDFEPIEFNPQEMIEKYVVDEEVTEDWVPEETQSFFTALLAAPFKRACKAVEIIDELNSQSRFDAAIAFKACQSLFKVVQTSDYDDLVDARAILGRIFGRLCSIESSFVDRFLEAFPEYRIDLINGFLEELAHNKKFDLITESSFWMTYQWRPFNASHVEILDTFQVEKVSEAFPLYESLYPLYDIILATSEEEDQTIDVTLVTEKINEVQDEIKLLPEFSIAVIEMIIEKDEPTLYSVAKEFLPNQKIILETLEALYFQKNSPADSIAAAFIQLETADFSVQDFLKAPSSSKNPKVVDFHAKIASSLP